MRGSLGRWRSVRVRATRTPGGAPTMACAIPFSSFHSALIESVSKKVSVFTIGPSGTSQGDPGPWVTARSEGSSPASFRTPAYRPMTSAKSLGVVAKAAAIPG